MKREKKRNKKRKENGRLFVVFCIVYTVLFVNNDLLN